MILSDYKYYDDYLKGLQDYYNIHQPHLQFRKLVGLCKEMERLEKMLKDAESYT